MPHRPALEEAAEGHSAVRPGEVTRPDLEGVTHIPESELPERKPCVPLSLFRARAQRRRADPVRLSTSLCTPSTALDVPQTHGENCFAPE